MTGMLKMHRRPATIVNPPRVGRNEKCWCGSGKKFKQCCLLLLQPRRQTIPTPPQAHVMEAVQQLANASKNPIAQAIIEERVKEFRERFGREPGDNDRIFFQTPSQQEVIDKVSIAMRAAKIDPAFIYAFQKTGLIVVVENMSVLTGEDLQLFMKAIDEYRSEHNKENQ